MASLALHRWHTDASRSLDEIESAHRAIGGAEPGRRYATQQINHAYTVLLSSHFQRFCRDLHSEAVDHLTSGAPANARYAILRAQLTVGRKLDTGNPNPGNIGSDFGRFQMEFWKAVVGIDARNTRRQTSLNELAIWRNAIAHQDFDPAKLGGRTRVPLSQIRVWRRTCNALAADFDVVVSTHLQAILGSRPW